MGAGCHERRARRPLGGGTLLPGVGTGCRGDVDAGRRVPAAEAAGLERAAVASAAEGRPERGAADGAERA